MALKIIQKNKLKTICQIREVNILGMPLIEWKYKSCIAHIAEFPKSATLYKILSKNEGKGEATALLKEAKKYYEDLGKKFGGSVALNEKMRRIYQRLGITEYI